MPLRIIATLTLLAAALTGCELDGWLQFGSPDDGRLTLGITDAPADQLAEVWMTFTGIDLRDDDGNWTRILFSRPLQVDLLELQGEERKLLLDKVSVESRRYRFVQLLVDTSESYVIMSDGRQYSLFLDEQNNELFGTSADFTVPGDGTLDLTIDIDLRRGLFGPTPQFLLRPAMRLVRTERSGSISGRVSADMLNQARGCPNDRSGYSVYVFSGHNATPHDMRNDSTDPLTSVWLADDNSYAAAYLPEGDYTLAFTCQGADDQPLTVDDDIDFSRPVNTTVTAGDTVTVNFTGWSQ